MNKGDLPLMYSCVCLCFFGKFIDLVGFLGGGGGWGVTQKKPKKPKKKVD